MPAKPRGGKSPEPVAAPAAQPDETVVNVAHTDTGEVLLVVQRGAVTVQIRMWPEGAVQTARALADSAAKALGHTFQGRPA